MRGMSYFKILALCCMLASCQISAPFSVEADISDFPGYTYDISVSSSSGNFINNGEEIMLPYNFYKIDFVMFDSSGELYTEKHSKINHEQGDNITITVREVTYDPITVSLSRK